MKVVNSPSIKVKYRCDPVSLPSIVPNPFRMCQALSNEAHRSRIISVMVDRKMPRFGNLVLYICTLQKVSSSFWFDREQQRRRTTSRTIDILSDGSVFFPVRNTSVYLIISSWDVQTFLVLSKKFWTCVPFIGGTCVFQFLKQFVSEHLHQMWLDWWLSTKRKI